jgi:hypothetical protein
MRAAVRLCGSQRPRKVCDEPVPGSGSGPLSVTGAAFCHSDRHLMNWPAGADGLHRRDLRRAAGRDGMELAAHRLRDPVTGALNGRRVCRLSPGDQCGSASAATVTAPSRRLRERKAPREETRHRRSGRPCSAYAGAGPGEAWPRGYSFVGNGRDTEA